MRIIDWDPAEGDLCQGDVILASPDRLELDTSDEVKPRDHRLILAEGEVTGHHHAIWLQAAMFRDDGLARELAPELERAPEHDRRFARGDDHAVDAWRSRATGEIRHTAVGHVPAEAKTGTARLYRDLHAVQQLIQQGELTHGRLAIGFLVVEGGPVVLRHDEHDAVRIPPGRYYVGGQSEWDAAEERRVAD